MGPDILTGIEIVVVTVGVAGTVLDVLSLVRAKGTGLSWTAIVMRLVGIAALFALVLAGRGRPDFQDLIFVLYGIFAGIALWGAAAVVDVVLLVRHWVRRG
jgi:hypothetical protein